MNRLFAFAFLSVLLMFAVVDVAADADNIPSPEDSESGAASRSALSIALQHAWFINYAIILRIFVTFALLVAVMLVAIYVLRKLVQVTTGKEEPVQAFADLWRELHPKQLVSSRSGYFVARALIMAGVLNAALAVALFLHVLFQRLIATLARWRAGVAVAVATTDREDEVSVPVPAPDAAREADADALPVATPPTTGQTTSPGAPTSSGDPRLALVVVRDRHKQLFLSILMAGLIMLTIAEVIREVRP